MKTTTRLLARFTLLGIGLACFALEAKAASKAAERNTFRLQLHSTMSGTGGAVGPQGWTTSLYDQRSTATNQALQISCRGLATNQVYHLLASWGTNGELAHLSDFTPNRSGAILMYYLEGSPHHFIWTTNPSPVAAWSNHMSWVIFPRTGTNWCDPVNDAGWRPRTMKDCWDGSPGTNGTDQTVTTDSQGALGQHDSYGGGMGDGMGWGYGWPAMTNWWSAAATNWWPVMAGWCWGYTNLWSPGVQYGSNWWCHSGRGANHTMPFPDSLNSVPTINGLVVTDAKLQPVLTADLANPQSFTYNARCDFRNQGIVPGAAATLRASATQRSTHFTLAAKGLTPSTIYFMDINGLSVTPVATDRHGRLNIRALPSGMTGVRGIGSVSIFDRQYNCILRATLPPD